MEKNLNFEFLNKNCVFAAVCAASCKLKTRSLFLYFKVVFTLQLSNDFFSTRYVMSNDSGRCSLRSKNKSKKNILISYNENWLEINKCSLVIITYSLVIIICSLEFIIYSLVIIIFTSDHSKFSCDNWIVTSDHYKFTKVHNIHSWSLNCH